MDQIKVLCVVGARPNFMKIAPIMRVFNDQAERFNAQLVHTGQHYDDRMKDAFFRTLGIPQPTVDLGVGSGTHSQQVAQIMLRFEPVLISQRPDVVLVVGDVNSTIACALVAVRQQIPVVHVEAGLRSFDPTMPEEINRILTDRLADLLFTTEPGAAANLRAEGMDEQRIHFVGNVMIDTLLANQQRAIPAVQTLRHYRLPINHDEPFGLVTLHRPCNVDQPDTLARLVRTLVDLSQNIPLIFPVHPRTANRLAQSGLEILLKAGQVYCTDALDYLQLLGLMARARLVLSDSGGIQEETTALGIPCLTLRDSTERPITIEAGTNTLVGTDPACIRRCVEQVLHNGGKAGRIPDLWDGRAAQRIADAMYARYRLNRVQ